MENCIFCKLGAHELSTNIIWENDHYMATLDINPKVKGMTVVFPKKHLPSYLFKNDDQEICSLMLATKQVTKILEKGLGVTWVFMRAEGFDVSHLHTKLYPVYDNYSENQEELTRKPAPEELAELAEQIKSANAM